MQFGGIPSDTIANIALGVWLVSGSALFYPRTQDLLAWKVWRLRPPSDLESRRIGPAWWAVCTAAGVNPDRYRVWIHEGPEATAPQATGSTVAVTSWSVYTLPPRNLEAVLAHELAHRLAVPGWLSLMGLLVLAPGTGAGCGHPAWVKLPGPSTVIKLAIGFLVLGCSWWRSSLASTVLLHDDLASVFAPIVVAWASRASEKYAGRVTADLGYGVPLWEVFTGREVACAQSYQRIDRTHLTASNRSNRPGCGRWGITCAEWLRTAIRHAETPGLSARSATSFVYCDSRADTARG